MLSHLCNHGAPSKLISQLEYIENYRQSNRSVEWPNNERRNFSFHGWFDRTFLWASASSVSKIREDEKSASQPSLIPPLWRITHISRHGLTGVELFFLLQSRRRKRLNRMRMARYRRTASRRPPIWARPLPARRCRFRAWPRMPGTSKSRTGQTPSTPG